MEQEGCWNCKDKGGTVRSVNTGIVYCASCGAAMDGKGAVTDLALLKTEPCTDPWPGESSIDGMLRRGLERT